MPETVTVRDDLQIIQVESFGDIGIEDFKRTLEMILKLHQERGFTKLFVDGTRQESVPDTMPVFEFGVDVTKAIQKVKIALAISSKTWRESQFFVNVARNRGAYIEMFDSADKALDWLIGETSVARP